jgi:hypothetical protein
MLFGNYTTLSLLEVIDELIRRQHDLLSPEEREMANVKALYLNQNDPRQELINKLDDMICDIEMQLN